MAWISGFHVLSYVGLQPGGTDPYEGWRRNKKKGKILKEKKRKKKCEGDTLFWFSLIKTALTLRSL